MNDEVQCDECGLEVTEEQTVMGACGCTLCGTCALTHFEVEGACPDCWEGSHS